MDRFGGAASPGHCSSRDPAETSKDGAGNVPLVPPLVFAGTCCCRCNILLQVLNCDAALHEASYFVSGRSPLRRIIHPSDWVHFTPERYEVTHNFNNLRTLMLASFTFPVPGPITARVTELPVEVGLSRRAEWFCPHRAEKFITFYPPGYEAAGPHLVSHNDEAVRLPTLGQQNPADRGYRPGRCPHLPDSPGLVRHVA